MFDKDNKFGFIINNNNENSNNIKNTDLPYTVSSRVLTTISASNITLDDNIIINNVSINKDRRYYIEFLGSKKLCNLVISEELGTCILCGIDGYIIEAFNQSTNISLIIINTNTHDTTIFTDLVIYEEEIKCLDSKYLETDLTLQNSISLGRVGKIGAGSSAIGAGVTASGDYSHAEGASTTASGECSHSEGMNAKAIGESSHAEGYITIASGESSHAEGAYTTASGECQHVQGKCNIEDTEGKYAHIVGNGEDDDNRSNAHTLDWSGNAWYKGQVEGTNLPYTVSSKKLTTVLASNIKIDEPITINNTSINKDRRYYIEFLGSKKLCSLLISEEQGNCIICNIDGYIIEAFNQSTNISLIIINTNTHDTTIFTDLVIYEEEIKCLDNKYLENNLIIQNSISLGRIGDIGGGSSAIGAGVEASAICSHAEGNLTKALGRASHVEGNLTIASGEISHAEGDGTIASSQYQHVQGKYNIEDTEDKYAHIVGNGTDEDARSNAHTLDWQGNAWYAGKLSQEGTPTEDKDLVTKKYVDDSIPIRSFPVNDTTRTGAVVDVNNLTVSGRYVLPKRTDGKQWTNLMMRAMINDGSGKGKSLLLSGYQNFIFYVNIENKKIYCDNLRIVYSIGTTDNTTDIRTEPYYLTTTNTKEYTPTNDYHPTTKKYVDDKVSSLPQLSFNENGELVVTINGVSKTFIPKSE